MSKVSQADLAVVQGNHHPWPVHHRRFQPGFAQVTATVIPRRVIPLTPIKAGADREVSELFRCRRTETHPLKRRKLTSQHHVTDPGDVGIVFRQSQARW